MARLKASENDGKRDQIELEFWISAFDLDDRDARLVGDVFSKLEALSELRRVREKRVARARARAAGAHSRGADSRAEKERAPDVAAEIRGQAWKQEDGLAR